MAKESEPNFSHKKQKQNKIKQTQRGNHLTEFPNSATSATSATKSTKITPTLLVHQHKGA